MVVSAFCVIGKILLMYLWCTFIYIFVTILPFLLTIIKQKKQVNLDCRSSLYWSLLLLFLISVGLDFMNYDKVILVNGF